MKDSILQDIVRGFPQRSRVVRTSTNEILLDGSYGNLYPATARAVAYTLESWVRIRHGARLPAIFCDVSDIEEFKKFSLAI
jgi:hypothetical protein